MTTIHPFPELRALAEVEARHRRQRLFDALTAPGMGFYGSELRAGTPDITFWTEAVVAEPCDLTRPASRDAVARLVAERAGGVSRPDFFLGESSRMWWSGGEPRFAPWDADGPNDALPGDVHIPTLAGVTDPAEALAIIVRHLWPESP